MRSQISGVVERLADHGHLEGPAVGVELAGGRSDVGDAHKCGGAPQGAGSHDAAAAAARSWATAS